MYLIDIIAGARPNFMKIAPIVKELQKRKLEGSQLSYRLVHTGQHYDANMSEMFFEQLAIPEPDINLNVGPGSQASQTAAIMVQYEKLLESKKSDLCMVVGDVNSTLAASITAQKLEIPVAHVEGGIRSGDWSMPEEINRMVTDAITNWFFTTSVFANTNLRNAGVEEDRIFFVGNTMIDSLLGNLERFSPPDFWHSLDLKPSNYFVLTLHRPSNVDEQAQLEQLLKQLCIEARGMQVVFPVHPRTTKVLEKMEGIPDNLKLVDPQPYLQFNYLVKNSFAVITDSGGITEEATVLNVPCMTLRENTERPETVSIGTNELVGSSPQKISQSLSKLFSGQWKSGNIPELWDGKASERIVDILEKLSN